MSDLQLTCFVILLVAALLGLLALASFIARVAWAAFELAVRVWRRNRRR
jgi:hypothetical protein